MFDIDFLLSLGAVTLVFVFIIVIVWFATFLVVWANDDTEIEVIEQ